MNLEGIFPLNKSDIESAIKFTNQSFEELRLVADELLSCLQDMNWPIAHYISNNLQPHINDLTNEILKVFRSNDEIWKYWIITALFRKVNYKINSRLINELIRMRDFPSSGEADNEVNQVAQEALEYLINNDYIE